MRTTLAQEVSTLTSYFHTEFIVINLIFFCIAATYAGPAGVRFAPTAAAWYGGFPTSRIRVQSDTLAHGWRRTTGTTVVGRLPLPGCSGLVAGIGVPTRAHFFECRYVICD